MNTDSKSFVPFVTSIGERNYLLTEGCFVGMLSKTFWGMDKYGRLHAELSFEITGLREAGVQYMARAAYFESQLDLLKEHLASWLGYEFLEQTIKAGGVDLETLEGKFATIEIAHDEKRQGYQDARRRVVGIHPPGSAVCKSSNPS
jgi:hypothetical protein